MDKYTEEVTSGERFKFGDNWTEFLKVLDDKRIVEAENSLKENIGLVNFKNMTVLDIGSGSGLFSLAAKRLGANVFSFDYDPNSVNCTAELKKRYFNNCNDWTIERGDVLNKDFIKSLKQYDIVYSWGVLHHTGNMWEALNNVSGLVKEKGYLFIAIYNDQGRASKSWRNIKRIYNKLPKQLKFIVLYPVFLRLWLPTILRDLLKANPIKTWKEYKKERGMSPWVDVVDWVGGYPFEVAKPEEIFNFFKDKGFVLDKLKTCGGGLGCNEYIFIRN